MSLRERREIVQLAESSADAVLVTLVRAAGSSYRQPGARLLAVPDGRTAGTISGGCLEADLLRKAQWRVREGAAMQRYDTGFDDDAEVPFGLGCGGVVDLLLERCDTPEARAVLDALRASLEGEYRAVVTQLPEGGRTFARVVLDRGGDVLFASEVLSTDRIVGLRAAVQQGSGEVCADAALFIEHMEPAQRMLLCGAGEDDRPVARFAAELGWTVVVADGRPQQARAERFPEAQSVFVTRSIEAVAPQRADAVVIMTHSFEQDRCFLTELLALPLQRQPGYIGLLGARHRSALLLQHAAEANGLQLADAVDRVHAPIGLELGGEGPESIALAIVAEVQQAIAAGRTRADAGDPERRVEGTQRIAAGGSRRMSTGEAADALQRLGSRGISAGACALDVETAAVEGANVSVPFAAMGTETRDHPGRAR